MKKFHKDKKTKDGLYKQSKFCRKEYYNENLVTFKKYYSENQIENKIITYKIEIE